MKPYVVAFIFARGGSKGVPRKNIRPLAGKPLIAWAIEVAQTSLHVDRVVVSTDDGEIARTAREWGAEVPFMRPLELAGDHSPEWKAWQHAITALRTADNGRELDLFVSVPATAPLRSVDDVDACVQAALQGDADVTLTVTPAHRSPYFNMVTLEHGYARLVIPPMNTIARRQDAPPVYDVTTVAYAARPSFVLSAESIFSGTVKAVVVPPERALDIDTEMDLQMAEFLLNCRLQHRENVEL